VADRAREVLFLVGREGAVLWADLGRSPVALPDSRPRWEAIWARRHELEEIAHSHPVGPLAFSREDETTMAALDRALGRALRYSVVAPGGMLRREDGIDALVTDEPWWTAPLRAASGMEEGRE
jgi:hypothetical protein